MLAPHRPVNPLTAVLFRSNHLKIPYARGTVTVQGLSLIWLTSSLGSSTCPEHVIRYLWRNISYRQHNNTNPVTKEPLKPEDLIGLNYSRKTTGEYHDPISFKPFSEHSHIVAIATTGNVYLAESIKGGKDLLDDVKFKKYAHGHVMCGSLTDKFHPREDVITLQNPHGMPPASIPSMSTKTVAQQTNDKQMTKPKPAAVNTVKEKAAVPCRSYILSWSILSNSGSRERLAVFEWPSRCIFDFHIRRSHCGHEYQITLG